MFFRRLLIIGVCIAWLTGCGSQDDSSTGIRGTLVSIESIGFYPTVLLEQTLANNNTPVPIVPRFNVIAYRVVYLTPDAEGNLVEASGALFVPVGADNLPMISLQHFTQTERSAVASVSPVEYGPDALLAASAGYAACAPDYLGFGISQRIHPYLHADSSANAVIDLVRACRSFCAGDGVALNGQLFLAGYSEGAYATLAAQRAMEADQTGEFSITAVACLSGPYDLESMAAAVLANPHRRNLAYFAYMLVAYDSIYGWNQLDEMFNQPYAGQVAALFDGSHSSDDVASAIAGTVEDVISPDFRARYANGTATNVLEAVRENTLLGWRPIAPIRLYHGTADDLVPYGNAVAAFNSFNSQPGTSVALYPIQGAGHEDAILASLPPAFQWFESLRK